MAAVSSLCIEAVAKGQLEDVSGVPGGWEGAGEEGEVYRAQEVEAASDGGWIGVQVTCLDCGLLGAEAPQESEEGPPELAGHPISSRAISRQAIFQVAPKKQSKGRIRRRTRQWV